MVSRLGRCCCVMVVVGALAGAGCGGNGASKQATAQTQTAITRPSTTQTQTAARETPQLKLATLEKNLPEFLNSGRIRVGTPGGGSTPLHAEVTKASCPMQVEKKVGTRFRCTVTGTGGVRGHVDITLTDPEGQSFEYEAKISGGPFGNFSGKVG